MRDRDLAGLRIRNNGNVYHKVVGIIFRRRDQLKPDVVWGVLSKVIQNNARFGLSDRLEVFRTMLLKPNTVVIFPRAGYRMGDSEYVEALQWLGYIGGTRNNVTHAGNGREVHLPGEPNVQVDGYFAVTNEVFEYLRCFWHWYCCMPNRLRPSATLKNNAVSV